jgi:hypothetical protein
LHTRLREPSSSDRNAPLGRRDDSLLRGMLFNVPYAPQASDTNENVDRAVFDGLRQMTPLRRLEIAARASRALH